MTVILFFVILAVLILVHEAGHFLAARYFGIRVDEFGIGFPPRLLSWKKGETRYSLNLIPFGGFVKIFGEDPTEPVHVGDETRHFARKPRAVQAAVLVAGVVGNMLLAWLLLSLGFLTGLPAPAGAFYGAPVEHAVLTVLEVLPHSPAERAGLQEGDTIVSLADASRFLPNPDADHASAFIASVESGEIVAEVVRQREKWTVVMHPSRDILEGRPAIGIAMEMVGMVRLPLVQAVWEGAKVTLSLTVETARALSLFIRDAFAGEADVRTIAGPVGIAGLVGEARAQGSASLLILTALISINLALINLIPFPALDGGRLLFVGIEALRRKPIPPKVAQTANAAGFIILLLLLAAVTANDLSRFW